MNLKIIIKPSISVFNPFSFLVVPCFPTKQLEPTSMTLMALVPLKLACSRMFSYDYNNLNLMNSYKIR